MKGNKWSKRLFAIFVGVFCFLTLFPGLGNTEVPPMMNYQGYLTNASGVPINGAVQMTFAIYDHPATGSALWTETQSPAVINGVYNVRLGQVTPIILPFNVPYYLGVSVGTDPEMTPRLPLLTVGYAFRAKYADSGAGGFTGFTLPYSGSSTYPGTPPGFPVAFSVTHTAQGVAGYFETNSTEGTNNTGQYPALAAFSYGSGDAIVTHNYGTGDAGRFDIVNTSSGSSAIRAISNGTGNAISGKMTGTGRAGDFQGNVLVQGDVYVVGTLTKGSGYFVQPHPAAPDKEIAYAFFEGPEHAVFIRGTTRLINGRAIIQTAEHFRAVAGDEDITVQFTPRSSKSRGLAAIEVKRDIVVVEELLEGTGSYDFDYFITAKRAGFEKHQPIQPNTHFNADNVAKEEFEQRYAKTDDMAILAIRNLLISNGILTKDGKLNTEMAERLGWRLKETDVARATKQDMSWK